MLFQFLYQQGTGPELADYFVVVVSFLVLFLVAAPFILMGLRITPAYKRLVVFRLGRFIGVKGPGVKFILPFIDKTTAVDLREQTIAINGETFTGQDKAQFVVDLTGYYKIVDPAKSVLEVANLEQAMQSAGRTFLRGWIGEKARGDVLMGREQLEDDFLAKLREVSAPWGVEALRVEVGALREA